MDQAVPLTVLGGYLGSGKTTVLNHVLTTGSARRLAVVVNDFGELAVDVDTLAADTGRDGIVNLPNGCVCCTLGGGLVEALGGLAALDPAPEHVVVEASGVADPAPIAAWGLTPGREPGGVVVCAAADQVRARASDRYVGREIRRQLVAADLVLVTRGDLVSPTERAAVAEWLDEVTDGAPRIAVEHGVVPAAVILGLRPDQVAAGSQAHHAGYRSWSWSTDRPVSGDALDGFLARLPAGVLRLKGWCETDDGVVRRLNVTGRSHHHVVDPHASLRGTRLVAIGLADRFDPTALTLED